MKNETVTLSREFKRENRYIVLKRKDLEKVPAIYRNALIEPLSWLRTHLPHRECLVIESDWPEYEPTWAAIERRMTGTALAEPVPPAGVEPEVLGNFGSHVEDGLEVFNVHIGEGQSVGMVDRAHVTRLQAEVRTLGNALDRVCVAYDAAYKERDALQAEMIKARELLTDVRVEDCGNDVMGEAWHDRLDLFLGHQSAPAEQPAPVAVVLPEQSRGRYGSSSPVHRRSNPPQRSKTMRLPTAYYQGRLSREKDMAKASDPYRAMTARWAWWLAGYNDMDIELSKGNNYVHADTRSH